MIASVLIRDFVTAVEHAPSLILLGGSGKVRAAALPAVQGGVRIGMRSRQARALYPEAVIRSFDDIPYQELATEIGCLLDMFSPRFEPAPGFWQVGKRKRQPSVHPSAALFYIDLGKLREADSRKLAEHLIQTCEQQLGLCPCVGLARGKFPASVAARASVPGRVKCIPSGHEAAFLAPYPIRLLPLEAEPQRRLSLLGIRSLGQLAALPAGAVAAQIGGSGRLLHRLASGDDPRPVIPVPSRPRERLTQQLEGVIEDYAILENVIRFMADRLTQRLNQQGYRARSLALVMHLDDHTIQRRDSVLRQPTADVGRALLRLLSQTSLSCGVLTLEIIADDLAVPTWQQLDLFAPPSAQERLDDLLRLLGDRPGADCLYGIQAASTDHRLLEQRFRFEPAEAA